MKVVIISSLGTCHFVCSITFDLATICTVVYIFVLTCHFVLVLHERLYRSYSLSHVISVPVVMT